MGAGRDPASVVRRVRAGLHLEQRVALVRTLPDQRTPGRPRWANRLQHLVKKAKKFHGRFSLQFLSSSFFYQFIHSLITLSVVIYVKPYIADNFRVFDPILGILIAAF